jgi:putative flavoprotein involved in K+ transport
MGAAVQLRSVIESSPEPEHFEVLVIGGGQAGLSVGYHLKRSGQRFAILDAEARVGDVWRKRWDSLRLFSPARFDSLDGMPFPADGDYFPTHHEMGDYLEAYARHFELPVLSGERVQSLTRREGRYFVQTADRRFSADQVVVAMSNYQKPRTPALGAELRRDIVQVHAGQYKNPSQLRQGDVLLVGAGNSGAEIALELARTGRRVWLSGPSTGEAPIRIASFWGRWLLARLLFRVVFHRLLTIETPMGRKARPTILTKGAPLIRTRVADLLAAGVVRAARFVGTEGGRPRLEDGTVLDVENVVWCTGFEPGFSWIELPIFDERGEPRHEAGVVPSAPGLYFVGLHFLYSMSSSMIHGVGRDAARIARELTRRAAR